MKDRLEKFMTENREAFNDAEPNPLLWLRVEEDLQKRKKTRTIKMQRVLAYAASVIIVLGFGMVIGLNLDKGGSKTLPMGEQYAEFQEAEHYFQKQINVKQNALKEHQVDSDVQDDLSQLDAVYNEMKAELLSSNNKDNSAIIEAMINNYRIRLEILERILDNVNTKSQYHEENISL